MTTINPYLTFLGNCEEAFNFYKSVFGGEFQYVGRFLQMPDDPKYSIPEEDKNKIMHISLPISKETVLMGSDTGGEWGAKTTVGNNMSLSVNAESKDDADRFFERLSDGGKVTMPIADTFWGDYFGMCTDKFDINWMISFNENAPG
ncbi:MAG: VOC family protein [Cyclobacteriaceae bacterium]